MSKEDVAFAEWAREVEGQLPDDLRNSFKSITDHPQGRELFRGVGRREDYNRRVNEVEAERRRLQEWFDKEAPKNALLAAEHMELQDKLSNYEQTLKELGLNDGATRSTRASNPEPPVAKKEEIEQLRKEVRDWQSMVDRALPKLIGDVSAVTQKIVKEGFNIDPRDVLSYAAERNMDPLSALDSLTEVDRRKRAEVNQKALEEKWKEEGRREALSKLPSPTYIRPTGPTVIDTLNNKDFASDPKTRVSDAVKDFLEMGAGTSGSGLV